MAIKTPADMKGLKIRAIENPALAAALQALGANPTPMPYGEVYTGIQTGVVKGATLDWGSVNSMHLYELVKHATSPSAAFLAEPRPIIMSDSFWKSLNKAEQDAVTKAIGEAAAFERQTFKDVQAEAIKAVEKAGVKISEIDEEAFLTVLRPVWDKWAKDLARRGHPQGNPGPTSVSSTPVHTPEGAPSSVLRRAVRLIELVDRALGRVDRLVVAICCILLFGLFAIMIVAVYFRFVVNSSLLWGEELVRYMAIWLVFLGLSSAPPAQ